MGHHPPALVDFRWHVVRVGVARVACARGARGSTVATIFLSTLIIAIFSANLCTIAAMVQKLRLILRGPNFFEVVDLVPSIGS